MWKKIRSFLSGSLKVILGIGEIREGNNIVTVVRDFLTQGLDFITDVDRIAAVLKASVSDPDKLALAADMISEELLRHPALVAHKVDNPADFKLACEQLAQGFFTLRKSLSGDGVQTIGKEA